MNAQNSCKKSLSLAGFQALYQETRIYAPEEIEDVFSHVRRYFRFSWSTKKLKYFNVPCCFDIETTSFYQQDGKNCGTMYAWTFGIYGAVIMGRTWEQFTTMMSRIVEILKLTTEKRLLVYCHNLAFEFQWMCYRFDWENVFALDNRKPLYALTTSGIEFRCSLLLSGYSLAVLGNELLKYPVKKMTGDLDYSLMRHSKTPLTEKEIGYCRNDVRVVMSYIAECIETEGGIAKIPLTKTGYARRYCRNQCFYADVPEDQRKYKRLRYRTIIKQMLIQDVKEYEQMKRGFMGGFTHANGFAFERLVYDVTSMDFTSSYPTVLIAEQYPMSSAEIVEGITSVEELEKNLRLYCCLFDIEIIGLEQRFIYEHYLSESRCFVKEGMPHKKNKAGDIIERGHPLIVDNGRIVQASRIMTTITEQDYWLLKACYKWEGVRVSNFRRYKKGYLPTDFVRSILQLYKDKTQWKGVKGKEAVYAVSKAMLNSLYGMCVTDPCREEFIFDGEHWLDGEEKPPLNIGEKIAKYNESPSRFSFFCWGIWCTSYARRNLWSGILECGEDYIYSDTDSLKYTNAEKHQAYFNKYNEKIRMQLIHAMEYHGLDPGEIEPLTQDGEKKCMGVWDFDGHYSCFKTLGAKRYLVQYSEDPRNKKRDHGKVVLTVAGLNKKRAIFYLCDGWCTDLETRKERNSPFDRFNQELDVPGDFTGKNTHYYFDEARDGVLIDYLGDSGEYHELSGIQLDKAEYSLKISKDFIRFLLGIKQQEW